MSETKINIFEKLHLVTTNVEKIYKVKNKGMPYKTINHNTVSNAVRKQIIEQRLFINPIVEESLNQGSMHKVIMSVEIYDIDNPTDKVVIGKFPALGLDTQDKGYGKAISYAYKYILQKTFMMEISDDEEVDAHNNEAESTSNKLGNNKFQYLRYNVETKSFEVTLDTDDLIAWSKELENMIAYIEENDRKKGMPTLRANKNSIYNVAQHLETNPNPKVQNFINIAKEILDE